jgi:hypothetical protein
MLLIRAILLMFIVGVISGCHLPINVEPVVFHHTDEVVQEGSFMVLADRRVFAVMSFLNVCGFDHEANKRGMHPVRVQVRDAMQAKVEENPEALVRWKRYYQEHHFPDSHYLNYALSLSDDYPFKRIRPFWELWNSTEAIKLAGLPAMLNEFWETLEMEAIWEEVKPAYLTEINRYDYERMALQVDFVWDYLRMERQDDFTFISVPNLMDSYYMAIASEYENYCYAVESPGSGSYDLNVHEYLHSMVNPMVIIKVGLCRAKLKAYYQAGKDMSGSYQRFSTYVCECMVRAVDYRINAKIGKQSNPEAYSQQRVEQLTRDGLLLVQPFYDLLIEYEASEMNFEEFLPILLKRLPEYEGGTLPAAGF